MPAHLFYMYGMISPIHWNIYYGPLLLGIGIVLQALFIFRPRLPFFIPCLGAACIAFICYMDRDVALFVGQIFILLFQFLIRRSS